jgi:WD40 repeat protein/serine/threonine protein kinase
MNQRKGAGSEDTSKDTVLEGSAASPAPAETIAVPGSDETVPPAAPGVAAAEQAVAAEWVKGDVILDLYEVAGLLGEGGMGKVYRVRHRGWNLDLAVKSPRAGYFQTEEQKQNFVRECETWIDLGLHPHTVSCYYVRTLGGIPRVFAEYVEGGSLADWIKSGKLYDGGAETALKRILDVAIQFAWGLGYAHERELIHQDVKPANVMLTPEGVAKVTDFGLAQARPVQQVEVPDGKGGTVLVRGRGMTPAYCSPEQAAGAELSRQTDIWSWGVSVLEMFTGGVTWMAGQAAAQALESYLEGEGEAGIPHMPQEVAELLRQCFAKEPTARPKDMAVVEQLRACYRVMVGEEYAREEPKPAELLADALNNRAVSLLDLGKRDEAEEMFEEALKSDPHHPEATYNRGLVLWRNGSLTDDVLVTQLEEMRKSHVADWRDEYYLGLVHCERGDAEAAGQVLQEAARIAPSDREVQRALICAKDGRAEWSSWVRELKGHTKPTNSVTFSPDGCLALSGSDDGTLRLWKLATGRCVRVFEGHTDCVKSVTFSPDGCRGLSGSGSYRRKDSTLRLWELGTGKCLRVFEGHTDMVSSVAISANGCRALSGSMDGTLRLWDLATGKCVQVLKTIAGRGVSSVAISPNGLWALSGLHDVAGGLRLWELATGKCLREFGGQTSCVHSVTIGPDGLWGLSGHWDNTLRLWQLATGKCMRVYKGHTFHAKSVAMSPDGYWAVSAGEDMTLRLWEVATGKCVRTFRHEAMVESVAISPDGSSGLSGCIDGSLRLWRLKASGPAAPIMVARPRSAIEVSQVTDQVAQELDRARALLGRGLAQEAAAILAAARRLPGYERNTELLSLLRQAASNEKRVRLAEGWCVRSLEGHGHTVTSVAISPDGQWGLSGSWDNTLRLWQLATGKCMRVFEGHTRWVNTVAISPDGLSGLSGSDDLTLRLWDLATGKCVRVFEGHAKKVNSVAISPDGCWGLSGDDNHTLKLWKLATGEDTCYFWGHKDPVNAVAISADGRRAVSGSNDKTVMLWDLATGNHVRTLKGHKHSVSSVAISPDGCRALSGSSDLRLWDLATGKCVRTFQRKGFISSVAFTPDGSWALTGTEDKMVCVWDLSSGKCVRVFESHTDRVKSVAISPDGHWVLSGGWDQMRLWQLVWDVGSPRDSRTQRKPAWIRQLLRRRSS